VVAGWQQGRADGKSAATRGFWLAAGSGRQQGRPFGGCWLAARSDRRQGRPLGVAGWQLKGWVDREVGRLEVTGWQQGRADGKVGRLEVSGLQQGRANGKVGR